MDHTVLLANNTISAYTRKHSPAGATTHICIVKQEFNLLQTVLSTIFPLSLYSNLKSVRLKSRSCHLLLIVVVSNHLSYHVLLFLLQKKLLLLN